MKYEVGNVLSDVIALKVEAKVTNVHKLEKLLTFSEVVDYAF